MAFMQIIEFRTADINKVSQIDDDWHQATEGKRTARRQLVARDHFDPNRYFAIVYFDSYESAMENSELPETKATAEQYMKATDGEPAFYNLDVIADRA